MKPLSLSCADFTFPLLEHDSVLKVIHLLNLQGIDIGLFTDRSHLLPKEISGKESKKASELMKKMGNLNLEVSDVFIQPGASLQERAANHPDLNQRREGWDYFRSALEFTACCGCNHLTGLPGMFFEGVDPDYSFKLAAEESLKRTLEAAKLGITYGVEPHVGSICPTPKKTTDFLKLSEPLTLTLDYGHFIYAGYSNEEIDPLLKKASHFHARGGAVKQLQVSLKENIIDFDQIIEKLQKQSYLGWLCLEYVWVDWEGCNRVDNLSETILLRDLIQKKKQMTQSGS